MNVFEAMVAPLLLIIKTKIKALTRTHLIAGL